MKYRSLFIVAFCFAVNMANAQTDFSLFGLGRNIVTSDHLTGPVVENDNVTPNKGVGGYTLFDLGGQVTINNTFGANFILRMRNPYGSFYGANTFLLFRQARITGRIGRIAKFEIGDNNYIATPYTLWNYDEIWNDYESEIFAMRRDIQRYENFNFGNQWRLQGVQTFSDFDFASGIQNIKLNLWGNRTNATNETSIPDRFMFGGRMIVKQSDPLTVGLTYNEISDIAISTGNYNYQNRVFTIDPKYTLDNDNMTIEVGAETGISHYSYTDNVLDSTVTNGDYFYDVKASVLQKNLKLKLTVGYRNVGPQFYSTAAQTLRLNVNDSAHTFPTYQLGAVLRPQDIFDRFTDERIYNRNLSSVLYDFMPEFGNVTPYGTATPNRKGISIGLATDTSLQVLNASANVDLLSEVLGEGVTDLRSFTSIRGGLTLNLHKVLGWEKTFTVRGGARLENTTRSGDAPVDFKSTLIDGGLGIEFIKKLDFLVGAKILSASGNEYRSSRDQFNQLTTYSDYTYDASQSVYSVGLRLRFAPNAILGANYNIFQMKNNLNSDLDYNRDQLFVNFSLSF